MTIFKLASNFEKVVEFNVTKLTHQSSPVIHRKNNQAIWIHINITYQVHRSTVVNIRTNKLDRQYQSGYPKCVVGIH
jgi:hypothetical protein